MQLHVWLCSYSSSHKASKQKDCTSWLPWGGMASCDLLWPKSELGQLWVKHLIAKARPSKAVFQPILTLCNWVPECPYWPWWLCSCVTWMRNKPLWFKHWYVRVHQWSNLLCFYYTAYQSCSWKMLMVSLIYHSSSTPPFIIPIPHQ